MYLLKYMLMLYYNDDTVIAIVRSLERDSGPLIKVRRRRRWATDPEMMKNCFIFRKDTLSVI